VPGAASRSPNGSRSSRQVLFRSTSLLGSLQNLPASTQLLLAQLRTKAVEGRWRSIDSSFDRLRTDLEDPSAKPRRRMTQDTARALPAALLSLRIAKGSPNAALAFYNVITGETPTTIDMARWKRWLTSNDFPL
jgi:hypothetical protein